MSFQPQPYQPQYVPPYEDYSDSQAQSRTFKMLQGLMSNEGLYSTFKFYENYCKLSKVSPRLTFKEFFNCSMGEGLLLRGIL